MPGLQGGGWTPTAATARRIAVQICAVGVVGGLVWYMIATAAANLAAMSISSGFGFLERTAGIPIGDPVIAYDPAADSYGRAILAGLLNTLKVGMAGIVGATLLGTAAGLAQLSGNWLARTLAILYVDALRNVPLLLQLLFWYALLLALPEPRQALQPLPDVFLCNRGLRLPALDGMLLLTLAPTCCVLGLTAVRLCRSRPGLVPRRPQARRLILALALAAAFLPAVAHVAVGGAVLAGRPELRGFDFRGGIVVSPEFAAMTAGLITYTGTFIAEVVRSGVRAVPKGQWEAAAAMSLGRATALRLVILPQALRIIIPPLTSQYLNLIKNSSLAVAIGFRDVVSVTSTAINQTGQAVEGILIIVATYLAFSLVISAAMARYGSRGAAAARR